MIRFGEIVAGSLTIANADWLPLPPSQPPVGITSAAPVAVSTFRSQAGMILLLVFAAVLGSLIALGFKRATQ